MSTEGVNTAKKKVDLEYPIHNVQDYGGRIKFSILQDDPVDFNEIAEIGNKADNAVAEAVGAVTNEEKSGMFDSFNGLVESTFKNRTPKLADPKREVSLYLPIGLQYRDNVVYENFDMMSTKVAAIAGGASALGKTASEGLSSGASSQQAKLAVLGLQSKLPAEVAGAIREGGQITTNPNTRALFKQVNIREFAFQFKFIPQSEREAEEVRSIIQFFREELYPTEIFDTIGDTKISLGYNFPNKFQISVEYNDEHVATKIKPCFLRDVGTTYNPQTMAMHKDGSFSEIEMTLNFQETKTLSRTDIQEGF